jgi:predicted NBD/HSP70 family sugar kinase
MNLPRSARLLPFSGGLPLTRGIEGKRPPSRCQGVCKYSPWLSGQGGHRDLLSIGRPAPSFCVAGGMAAALDLMTPALSAAFARQAFPLAREGVAILPAALGDDAGLLGAAAAVLRR